MRWRGYSWISCADVCRRPFRSSMRHRIELKDHGRVERPIRSLRLVFEIDLGERKRHILDPTTHRVAERNAGHDDVREFQSEVFRLRPTGPAMGNLHLSEAPVQRAGLHNLWRGFVDGMRKGQVVESRPAGDGSSGCDWMRDTPRV